MYIWHLDTSGTRTSSVFEHPVNSVNISMLGEGLRSWKSSFQRSLDLDLDPVEDEFCHRWTSLRLIRLMIPLFVSRVVTGGMYGIWTFPFKQFQIDFRQIRQIRQIRSYPISAVYISMVLGDVLTVLTVLVFLVRSPATEYPYHSPNLWKCFHCINLPWFPWFPRHGMNCFVHTVFV